MIISHCFKSLAYRLDLCPASILKRPSAFIPPGVVIGLYGRIFNHDLTTPAHKYDELPPYTNLSHLK